MESRHRPDNPGQTPATDQNRPDDEHRPSMAEVAEVRPLWVTQAQALEVLGISERTLRRRVQEGTIERRKQGRRALYRMPQTDTGHAGRKAHTGQHLADKPTPARRSRPVADVADENAVAVRILVERLEAQAVELAHLRAENEQLRNNPARGVSLEPALSEAQAQRDEALADRARWEARARRWRRALRDKGLI